MRAIVKKSRAEGVVIAPPSKSVAHRLLIAAGLSKGQSRVDNLSFSEDIKATIHCLEALGARVEKMQTGVLVEGADVSKARSASLYCNESGSTLRFFVPLCLLSKEEMHLSGTEKLLSRPLSVYEDICQEQGLPFLQDKQGLKVQGRLQAGEFIVPGDISSQFMTGFLFALPLLEGDSVLTILPPLESASYLDLTVQALERFGIEIQKDSDLSYRIPGGQSYKPQHVKVEGDYSNAAFLSALNELDNKVEVQGLWQESLQGDRVYPRLFQKIKAGDWPIDLSDCPDLGPILFTIAAADGKGAHFVGTKRLKIKESDRASAMKEELEKFGARLTVEENEVIVHPAKLHTPRQSLSGHNDHRIAMSLAILGTRYGAEILGAQAVNKSYPEFWEHLSKLKVEVELHAMD
jgi:3-phosphoshikimate 1-carboxyvinyltransferase